MPMFHLEHKALSPENPTETGRYHQWYGVTWDSLQLTENEEANTLTIPMQALAMNGPTASGYLS